MSQKENDFQNFFESDMTAEYIRYITQMIYSAAEGIASSCKKLDGTFAPGKIKSGNNTLNDILTMCFLLMRNNKISELLVKKKDKLNRTIIDTDRFIREFCSKCMVAYEGKCSFKINNSIQEFVINEKDILIFLMLGFVRKSILNANGESLTFYLSTEADEKNVKISVKTAEFIDLSASGEELRFSEFFDKYFDNVIEIFSEKLDISCIYSASGIEITIPKMVDDGGLIFESPDSTFEDDIFSPYSIMLGGLYSEDK